MSDEEADDLIISIPEEILLCCACQERMLPPVASCINGHALCLDCSLANCPVCGSIFFYSKNTYLNQLLAVMPFRCRNHDNGCDISETFENLNLHEERCNYREIKCLREDCLNPNVILVRYKEHLLQMPGHSPHIVDMPPSEVAITEPISFTSGSFDLYSLIRYESAEILMTRVHFNAELNIFLACVIYVGNLEDVCKYKYQLWGDCAALRTYGDYCLPPGLTCAEMIAHPRCFVVKDTRRLASNKFRVLFSVHKQR